MNFVRALSVAMTVLGLSVPATVAKADDRPFSWTGFYVGGQVGGGWSNVNYHLIENARDFRHHGDGALIGGYVGYNRQLAPLFVIGVEAEGSWADIDRSSVRCTIGGPAICSSSANALGSVRGRIGVLPAEKLMLYMSGGWAFGDFDADRQFVRAPGRNSGVSDDRSGWVLGGGMELALSRGLIARLQWDHYDFGTEKYPIGALSDVSNTEVKLRTDTLRVGLSYKFN